jgi:peptidyl-dipeptidase A
MHRKSPSFLVLVLLLSFSPAASPASPIQERADRFLALANAGYQALYRVNSEAQWLAVTDVTPQHDAAAEATGKAYAAFNGNPGIITEARELLTHQKELNELTVRQLKQLLLNAAEGPMTNPDLVAKRVAAETKQASILNGFEFKLNGQPITVNQIDDKLEKSVDLNERKAVWEASKESGPALKPNLVTVRDLRNGVAKEMKYPDYFSLEVAAYGMTTDEMLKMLEDWMATLRPLYLQLHTWAKYKLAEKFHQPVPKKIPAHWINNRWGQEWPGLVEAANIDKYFEGRQPEWIIKTAEQFYTGLGFRRYHKVSGKDRTYIRYRRIRSARKTRTPPAGMSTLKTTSVRFKASSPTHAGSSPRTTSSVTDTTLKLIRARKFLTCYASAQRQASMKALAN